MTNTRASHWTQFWASLIQASQPIYINTFLMSFSSPIYLPRSFSRTFALVCCYHSVLSGMCKPWSSLVCNILNFLRSSSVFSHDVFFRALYLALVMWKQLAKLLFYKTWSLMFSVVVWTNAFELTNTSCLLKLFFRNMRVFTACHKTYLWTPLFTSPQPVFVTCLLMIFSSCVLAFHQDIFLNVYNHLYLCVDHCNFHDLTTVIILLFLSVSRINTQVVNRLPVDNEIF
jgi:hypothetical protein